MSANSPRTFPRLSFPNLSFSPSARSCLVALFCVAAGGCDQASVDAAVNGGDGFIYFIRDGQTYVYDMDNSGASPAADFPAPSAGTPTP